jgi:dimethylhistidine N-methyltransferase
MLRTESMHGGNGRFRVFGSSAGDGARARAELAADVARGLGAEAKTLSCRWLYDEEGSRLFDAICALPEYYIPRAETAILAAHAGAIVGALPPGATIVELGSGSAAKTRLVLEAALEHAPGRVRYVPIDISATMLAASAEGLLADYPRLDIVGIAGTYEEGLGALPGLGPAPKLILWLGSNVGNFTRPAAAAFLREVRGRMGPRDRFLLGVDLRKDPAVLALAYDDPAGVTARFSLNLLLRINRELGGDFDLGGFRHQAEYDQVDGRVIIHIVSVRAQTVQIRDLGMTVCFRAGERIHTEDSYKYSRDEIGALLAAAGLRRVDGWTDPERRFASVLAAL